MTLKKTIAEYQGFLGIVGLILGIFFTILGVFAVFLEKYTPSPITKMNDAIGDWIYWLLVIGVLMILFLGLYVWDRNKKIKEFNELMDTQSKSKFVKNIARLETLALILGPRYEEEFIEKEKHYKIKR